MPASQEIGGATDASSIAVQNVGIDHNSFNVVAAQQQLIFSLSMARSQQSRTAAGSDTPT